MISQSELKEILTYDDQTGLFYWLKDRGRRVKAGQWAGSQDKEGYIVIRFDGKAYKAHRLAWLYVYGEFPSGDIDHRDGVCHNNRILNLRLATNSQNQQNKKKSIGKSSKYLGVHFCKKVNKFQALINVNGVQRSLGYFDSEIEAHEEYLVAKSELHPFQPAPRLGAAISEV